MEATNKTMTNKSFSDWIAAYTGGAIMGTYQWFNHINMNIRFNVIAINWLAIVESVPAILVAGFVGVIAKKGAEDGYAWLKKKITKK